MDNSAWVRVVLLQPPHQNHKMDMVGYKNPASYTHDGFGTWSTRDSSHSLDGLPTGLKRVKMTAIIQLRRGKQLLHKYGPESSSWLEKEQTLRYVYGHKGIEGDEKADQAAK